MKAEATVRAVAGNSCSSLHIWCFHDTVECSTRSHIVQVAGLMQDLDRCLMLRHD